MTWAGPRTELREILPTEANRQWNSAINYFSQGEYILRLGEGCRLCGEQVDRKDTTIHNLNHANGTA